MPEDEITTSDNHDFASDDSNIPLSAVVELITNGTYPDGTADHPDGSLMLVVDAEHLDPDVRTNRSVDSRCRCQKPG